MLTAQANESGLFSAEELEELESQRSDGITSQEVISLFQARGVKLSEATFRKYVQLGLLPTSKRVGRKGKHRGSKGIYPVSIVRRINIIKRMMMDDMTLEEIRDSFISVQNELEKAQEVLDELFGRMKARMDRLKEKSVSIKGMSKELEGTKKQADSLMKKVDQIQSRLAILDSPTNNLEKGGLS
jgi:DNA-binding transcriptional MerR regulator